MFSSQTGSCQYWGGPQLATPFVVSNCFETAFVNASPEFSPCGCPGDPDSSYGSPLNCVPHYSKRGQCFFDQECGPGKTCQYGICKVASPFDNRNSIWRRENSRVVGYAPADYKAPDGRTCTQQPYYVVDETGKKKVVCPILTSHESQPQCNTCLNTVFECDRFRETNPQKYKQCLEYQRMIHYNVVTPNGQLIPMAVEMDGMGMRVMDAAMKKCASVCGSCRVVDRMSCDGVFGVGGCGNTGGTPTFF